MIRPAALSADTVLAAVLLLLALGLMARRVEASRLAAAAAALLALGWSMWRGHRPAIAVAAGIVLLVLLWPLATRHVRRRLVPFSAEEEAMIDRHLSRVPGTATRALLDQGLWINGRAGETLLREGDAVSHLFYLSAGAVQVASGGQQVATSGPGHFFGELDVLAHTPAIATVTLTSPARFWCITTNALDAYLSANPDMRPPLELALANELREKLRERNRRIVQLGEGAAA